MADLPVFPDDDLERLKLLRGYRKGVGHYPKIASLKLQALIARMEAAEDCARHLQHIEPDCEILKPWRKAAGK